MAPTMGELLLHPVRLRIIQRFLGDRRLTTAMLRQELADVAPATLYRQVATLAEAGVLAVVDEQRIRGAVERTYALRPAAGRLGPEEAAAMSVDDHRRAFTAFVASLLHDFDHYARGDDLDVARDGVGYRQVGLWLSLEELVALSAEMGEVLRRWLDNGPAPGRTRRVLTTIVLPADGSDST